MMMMRNQCCTPPPKHRQDEPRKGSMDRMGLDLVVFAFYVAWAEAKKEGLTDVASVPLGVVV